MYKIISFFKKITKEKDTLKTHFLETFDNEYFKDYENIKNNQFKNRNANIFPNIRNETKSIENYLTKEEKLKIINTFYWDEKLISFWLKMENLYNEDIMKKLNKNSLLNKKFMSFITSDEIYSLQITNFVYLKQLFKSIQNLNNNNSFFFNNDCKSFTFLKKKRILNNNEIYNLNNKHSECDVKIYNEADDLNNLMNNFGNLGITDNESNNRQKYHNEMNNDKKILIYDVKDEKKINIINTNKGKQLVSEKIKDDLIHISTNVFANKSKNNNLIFHETNSYSHTEIKNKDKNHLNNYNTNLNKKVLQKVFECEICLLEKHFNESLLEALNKNVKICMDCLRDLIFTSMKDFSLMPPRINKIELSEELIKNILTKNEYEKFINKKQEFYCQDKHYCQNKLCSNFINLDVIPSTQTVYKCSQCKNDNCLICRTLSHPDRDCYLNIEIKEKLEDETEKSFYELGYKKFPKCKIYIELSYGCNHMKCWNCSYEFCFECLTRWKGNICSKSCKLYNERMENILLGNEIDNLQRNQISINVQIINQLREQIRNRSECLHKDRDYLFLWRSKCDNCGYKLRKYGYRCKDCRDFLLCQICHYYRY